MAEAPSFFSGLVGGVLGAVVAVDVPADGERAPRPAPGTDWGVCMSKVGESARELDGFIQQLTFILGKVALGIRVGVEQLGRSLSEGRVPSGAILDRADFDQSIDAGRQGADFLVRGGKLALDALIEGAKVTATRVLIAVEHSRNVVMRNLPSTQEKISQTYASFLKGYQGRSVGYSVPSYTAPPASAYGAPSVPSAGGFFW